MLDGSTLLFRWILIISTKVRNNYTNTLHNICLIYTMHMSKNQGTRSNTSLENKYRPVSQIKKII